MEIIEALEKIEQHLARIAEALDADRPPPAYRYTLAAYPGYNWSSIDAEGLEHDDNGATRVMWHRHIYTRRSNPKYGHGVWFSRGAGRDDDGNAKYERLITFSTMAPVEPLPASVSAGMAKAPAPIATPAPTTAAKESEETPRQRLNGDAALSAAPPIGADSVTTPSPSEAESSPAPARPARTEFFRLLPKAIAAGLKPDIANSLTALSHSASYTEALATLEQHMQQLEEHNT